MTIAYSIASYQAHKHKMNTVLPIILDKIEGQGYSIKNQYISSNGNGVVIDPNKHIVAVVTILKDEPLILQSYNILDCEMNVEKAYRINSSDAGTTGMLLGNEGFKELGKYDSRDITEFYTHIDVNITVSDGTRSTVLTIPLINEKIVTYVANEQLYLAKDIVNNIKMLLEHSFEDMKRDISKNMDDTLDIILKDLEKQTGLEYEREVLKEFLSVTDKFKTKDFVAYNLIRVLVEDNSQDENSNIKLDKEVVLELSKYWAKLSDEEREGEKLLNKYIKLYNYKHKPTAKDNISNLDEIKKLKELLDMRAITKEEYNKKKKELLK